MSEIEKSCRNCGDTHYYHAIEECLCLSKNQCRNQSCWIPDYETLEQENKQLKEVLKITKEELDHYMRDKKVLDGSRPWWWKTSERIEEILK